MLFKHEYITDDFVDFLGTMLIYPSDSIFEEYHIIKAIEKCSKELTIVIPDEYERKVSLGKIDSTYIPTDWYIHSNFQPNATIDDTFISKVSSNHRIMLSFQMMPGIDMQNLTRWKFYSDKEMEELRQQVFKEELKDDNPVILINPNFISWVLKDKQKRTVLLTALISHELRHVCEQYVLEFDNIIKGSLNYDFKHNNPFQLNTKSETYIKLRNIIYYLSDEEQRARMQATSNVCKYAMENNATRSQLTASYYKTKELVLRYGITKQANKNLRMEIVSALKSEPLKFAHHLPEFRKAVNEITPIGHIKTIYKVLLLLGYFLEKHNYIKSGNTKDVKQFFSKTSVI